MKKYFLIIFLMFLGVTLSTFSSVVRAISPPSIAAPAGLSLVELKITGSEFVMLQNNTVNSIPDLSRYWIYNFNNQNPLASGVSNSSQQLPPAPLGVGQTILLSASGGPTCGAAVTAKLGLSLTDSGGFLEVVQASFNGGLLVQTAGDSVSWSSGANTTPGMIANAPSGSADPAGAYYRYQNPDITGSIPYLWQQADVDTTNTCQMDVKIAGSLTPGPSNPGNALLPGSPPPVTFVDATDSADPTDTVDLPAADIGLAAPQINELLPNPAAPQTDDEDEFIELYNSNGSAFDLTGFELQVGTTTTHTYSFPAGTVLQPRSFTAFFSVDTGLNMSNSGGQARLLDPFGNVISQSDVYGTAKDNQAWALGNGVWYWTITITPNAANVITPPLTVKSLSIGSTSKKSTATTAVKAAKTAKKTTANSPSAANSQDPLSAGGTPQAAPIHAWILAIVGGVAVVYALYEYRTDLANRFYKLRRN